MKKLETGDIKRIEIEILDFVVNICNNNHLTYFLSYGTLLGAVRHKGFIPWDDDIDICMPREDYNILLDRLSTDKSIKYKVLVPSMENYYLPFAKVIDAQTYIPIRDIEEQYDLGVWIDIFPIDGLSKHSEIHKRIINAVSSARHLAVYKKLPPLSLKEKIRIWPCWKFSRLIGLFPLLKWTNWLAKRKAYKDAELVTVLIDPDSNGVTFHKPMLEDLTEVEFEGKMYYAPRNYDLYLTSLYGDYMQLPPADKRYAHGITAFKINSKVC